MMQMRKQTNLIYLDNLLARVEEHEEISIVRVGDHARISPNSIKYTPGVLCSQESSLQSDRIEEEIENLNIRISTSLTINERSEIKKTQEKVTSYMKQIPIRKEHDSIENANVIFSTLVEYVNHYLHAELTFLCIKKFYLVSRAGGKLLSNKVFDVVIIDEAGQATEPECWIALLRGSKVILVSVQSLATLRKKAF